jgi:FlaA1/EpsC-like NDP-sugar epimerase
MDGMLITGSTGSLGEALVSHYYSTFRLHVQGRDPQKLLKLQMRYPGVQPILGDLRCYRLREAVRACRFVIHTAAQKYVNYAERYPSYTIDTNLVCTHDLADLAAQQKVEKFVFISTDKASHPQNVYGYSKFLAERVVLELADAYPDTAFVICRFGNIFGSNGSVVQLWLDALRRRPARLQVTHPEMTRFMFSLEDAAETVQFAVREGRSGDIIIRKMNSVCLRDILRLFSGAEVQVVGLRPGERMHETLYVQGEIATGRETPLYYILNQRDKQPLHLHDLDSATADRIQPEQLQHWFETMQRRAA